MPVVRRSNLNFFVILRAVAGSLSASCTGSCDCAQDDGEE